MIGLVRRGKVYYLRVRVPSNLLFVFDGRREFWKTLSTTSEQDARRLCPVLAGKIRQCFLMMRSGMLSDKQMRRLASGIIREGLKMFESWRFCGEPTDAWVAGWNALNSDALEKMQQELRDDIAVSRYDRVLPSLDAVLAKQSVIQPAKGGDEYNTLARHFAIAFLQLLEVEGERRRGNYTNPFDKTRYDITDAPAQTQPATPEKPAETSQLISKVIAAYIDEKMSGERWDVKTKQQNEYTLALMVSILGDHLVSSVTHQQLMELRNILKRLPANRSKATQYRGKSIEAVLRAKNVKPMSTTTVNNILTRIASFWGWCEIHEYIDKSPARHLSLPTSKRADEERAIYTNAELQRLLDAVADQARPTSHPERIWIVLIALYSGMRPNEIAQLYVDDIVTEDGVQCFKVDDKHPHQKVKNRKARRFVPVHPDLVNLGFDRYLKSVARNRTGRLFPKLQPHRDGLFAYAGRWLQDVNREFVTKDRTKAFYSIRHLVVTSLRRAGVDHTVIAELVGHKVEGETLERYSKGLRPNSLLETLTKLQHSVDFTRIREAAKQTFSAHHRSPETNVAAAWSTPATRPSPRRSAIRPSIEKMEDQPATSM